MDGKVFVDLKMAVNGSILGNIEAANQYEHPSLPISFTITGSCGKVIKAVIVEDPVTLTMSVVWERGEGAQQ
jgi:hypothetical protein